MNGLLCCCYYKFKGPGSGSDEASKQYRSQNEVEKAMGLRNKLAEITGGFLSIFNCCKLKVGTVGPKMPSVTNDVIDCPNRIIGCATASECLLISVTFPWTQIFLLAFALIGWVGDNGKTCASSWFVFLWYPDFWRMFVLLEELDYSWRMLHFQNMRKKFVQNLDQIPFLQTFRMVRHETWWTHGVWKNCIC